MATDMTGRSFVLLLARWALAPVFILTGYLHVRGLEGFAGRIAELGYPAPKVMAILATAALLGGGISLVLGALTPLGCIALILFMGPTTYSAHFQPALQTGDTGEWIQTFKNLGVMGGLLILLFSGAGRFSVDAAVLRTKK